ncbi:O-fucosyltransferase 36-like [Macadamia integrifolia]|uniref:O-fucosyltransferase 36-like n=1 Tax=Macadamia integrifolia TaxID=60698 RepID=UPI001C4E4F1C|nr:O-fucosyltransferase 36-like [Macadamia integrifolia]
MDRESSSDEEEDRRNLIDQNEMKPSGSSFEIEEFKNKITRRFKNFSFSKRYLLLICLLLFLVFFFFSIDIGSLFHRVTSVRVDSVSSRMREAELQALYLLKKQQLGLLHMWNLMSNNSVVYSENKSNSTLGSGSNTTSNSGLGREDLLRSSSLFDDFRSTVLKQITLNNEIQQALLSSHRTGNLSALVDENVNPEFSDFRFDRCRTVAQSSERRTIEWKPKSNKYLFAICVSGQMSNHLICLEKHMFFAALLGRILVIPSSKVDYQYSRVIDIDHLNKCFGRKVVVSFEEFSETKKNHLHIDRFICYVSLPRLCYLDEEHIKKLKNLGLSMGKLEAAWVEDIKEPKERTVEDVKEKFSSNYDVLAMGDVFYSRVEQDWVMQPGGPLAHSCKSLIEPNRLIKLTAQRFIQTFLGKNFVALHFRRHGFLKFCNAKATSCFYPIPQAADCITRVLERANAPVIYLSTDAAESETDLLQSLVMLNGKVVPLVKRPSRNSAEKWDALLYRHGLEGDSQVEAMLDKTICALSSVFIGASGSTFTEDILRLRKDWGLASLCDEYLCEGEQPNFIAENE